MLHSDIYVMTIHVISREMPLVVSMILLDFSCNSVARVTHLRRVYSNDKSLANIIELIKVMRKPQKYGCFVRIFG